ncbi:MAG: hypothetical protein ACLRQF_00485 [Thomasclavelia ramosa]
MIIYVEKAYIYPHNTPSIVNRGKIINYTKYFITDVFCVFQLALLMLLTGALMVRIIPCCRNTILCCIIIYLINLDKDIG